MTRKLVSAVGVACVAGALVLAGCATDSSSLSALPAQEYDGHLVSSAAGDWFRPCGSAPDSAPAWVTFTGASVEQINQARAAGRVVDGPSYFVRWRAAVTTRGEVGPQGAGKPAYLVRELLEIRPATDRDCGSHKTN